MDSTRVSKQVWTDVMACGPGFRRPELARMAANDFVDAKAGEGPAAWGDKDRPRGGRPLRPLIQEVLQKRGRPCPKRADAPLIAFGEHDQLHPIPPTRVTLSGSRIR